eukprot:89699-Amphidinium_carterae.1
MWWPGPNLPLQAPSAGVLVCPDGCDAGPGGVSSKVRSMRCGPGWALRDSKSANQLGGSQRVAREVGAGGSRQTSGKS